MTGALQNLYAALEPLRLYALRQDSLVDKELTSYAKGLCALEENIDELSRCAFIQTATGSQLNYYEKAAGLAQRESLDDEARRELILFRTGGAAKDYTPDGILNTIQAYGIEAELIENPGNESLVIRYVNIIDKSLDLDRIRAGVEATVPAHLLYDIDVGELTWDMLEQKDVSWDDWDALDFTWSEFDITGDALF